MGLTKLFLLSLSTAPLLFAYGAADQTSIVGTLKPTEAVNSLNGELRKVIRVVDGDTIVLSPNEKVRLIGVDTPETVHPKKAAACFGKEAKQFTRDAVEGKTIRLVLDKVNTKRRHKDRHGRTLAYAYLADGIMLNRELIRRGYAPAEIRFPFRYRAEFRELEHQALIQTVGLWSSCSLD
ncbi:MAG TPA: thermonuclease family protein [Candidatus Binatia bacterium]